MYLVLDSLYSSSGDNISSLLEQKWNTVSKSENIEALSQISESDSGRTA